jgi:hypothetical protein
VAKLDFHSNWFGEIIIIPYELRAVLPKKEEDEECS